MRLPEYPFEPRVFHARPGIALSYLDEGPDAGEVVVMLHGNPSWSFYWRHLVLALRDRYRCIVPDHVGMGLSDKPDDAPGATPVTLVVHDWGGMIGFGWALSHMAQVRRLVILNTAAFPMPAAKRFPWRLALGRDSRLGGWLIRRFNLFARGAAWFGTRRRLPASVRAAYIAPYRGWANAISTLRFMQDIPLAEGDRAWPLLVHAGEQLPGYADRPAFIGWGLRDFVFDRHCLEEFRRALPGAEVHAFDDAGHYVLEDKHEVLVPLVRTFLDKHPL